jgi:SAM-dependent methyltransferase
MNNYLLGGKDNFEVDRLAVARVAEFFPTVAVAARENRAFVNRAVAEVAGSGIRQFLDVGCGLPTATNTHQVAQATAREARIVYVDYEPMVMGHARALLTGTPEGVIDYVEADLREPQRILKEAARTLDFGQPVGLVLGAILHFVSDEDDPAGLVAQLVKALPSGSYLVMSHATGDYMDPATIAAAAAGPVPVRLRTRAQFDRHCDGLELLSPEMTSTCEWRVEARAGRGPTPAEVATYCAVARVP